MTSNRSLLLLLAVAFLISSAAAQDPGRRRVNREQMWPAPTDEDWKRPCLITWQRTWEDAKAVARETGRAILICVNMDGEIASEHYAGVRYRQPEITVLYEPYVTVVASVYRHTPRDFDEKGRRILCPRFGSVTCGEHIAIEPILYEKYFDEERVAPRHIMIELDGEETYDVYYTDDTASVFDAIKKGIDEREAQPSTVVRGDRSIVERVESRDIRDRKAVEKAYEEGDAALRKSLLEAAAERGGETPLDLLRLAIFGLDVEMSGLARKALAQSESPAATDLITDALGVPLEEKDRSALIEALDRLGASSPKARWLAVVYKGLADDSGVVDAKSWARASKGRSAPAMARDVYELEARRRSKARVLKTRPEDPEACIELAEASLELARKARRTLPADPRMGRVVARHMFADARRAALKAERLKASAWRVKTVLALVDYYRGDLETAYILAERRERGRHPDRCSEQHESVHHDEDGEVEQHLVEGRRVEPHAREPRHSHGLRIGVPVGDRKVSVGGMAEAAAVGQAADTTQGVPERREACQGVQDQKRAEAGEARESHNHQAEAEQAAPGNEDRPAQHLTRALEEQAVVEGQAQQPRAQDHRDASGQGQKPEENGGHLLTDQQERHAAGRDEDTEGREETEAHEDEPAPAEEHHTVGQAVEQPAQGVQPACDLLLEAGRGRHITRRSDHGRQVRQAYAHVQTISAGSRSRCPRQSFQR